MIGGEKDDGWGLEDERSSDVGLRLEAAAASASGTGRLYSAVSLSRMGKPKATKIKSSNVARVD